MLAASRQLLLSGSEWLLTDVVRQNPPKGGFFAMFMILYYQIETGRATPEDF
ncbi:type I toxin-antitoxin system ptaRNA1 family toxin [Halomonas qaidamensis]|uniref:Type I toxin-antitoxin system ptaRNA1 family toxin n=1 Tax=Halomonas qaidamensis TaxID=2866211 RepID=A0ABY6JTG6_9GAMM|nr:type I toxin-antitoxin system ptaRNA1 family toxin [Halomonas qaidamensis]